MAWLAPRQFLTGGAAWGCLSCPVVWRSRRFFWAAFALGTGVCARALEHLGKLPLHWFSRMQAALLQFNKIQVLSRNAFLRRWVVFTTIITMSFCVLASTDAFFHFNFVEHVANAIPFLMLGVASFAQLSRLVRFVTLLWRAAMGHASVQELFGTPAGRRGCRTAKEISSLDLEVERLSVADKSKPVLHEVSFRARAGAVTAFVGHSGSGKSTTAAVVAGLEQAAAGTVRIGRIPLQEFPEPELARIIPLVLQHPFLFSGTVTENIALGLPNALHEKICSRFSVKSSFSGSICQQADSIVSDSLAVCLLRHPWAYRPRTQSTTRRNPCTKSAAN